MASGWFPCKKQRCGQRTIGLFLHARREGAAADPFAGRVPNGRIAPAELGGKRRLAAALRDPISWTGFGPVAALQDWPGTVGRVKKRSSAGCAITGPMHRSKDQTGPSAESVSGGCVSSARLTHSTESIAAPSWAQNCSMSSFNGDGRGPHKSRTRTHRLFDGLEHFLYRNFAVGPRHSGVASSCSRMSRLTMAGPSHCRTPASQQQRRYDPLTAPSMTTIFMTSPLALEAIRRHFTGTSTGAPLSLIMKTTNFAGLVLLALRPTT